MSKRTYARVDHEIFSCLWRWARRRHRNKTWAWLKKKYFERRGYRNWTFVGNTSDVQGQPYKIRLRLASDTPIRRHVKVRSDANPYDPAYESYFEKREAEHMLDTFRGSRFLRFLWHEQRGICPVCNMSMTRVTGWRMHYCVPKTLGGSTSAENRVLLHPDCHHRVHCLRLSVSKPRLA